ncbi:MAG: DegV family EDD domain-containing protein [Chloroflexi bacterium]|nr:DegV family EDD domain-containing protein [Chloroflexota bacterium]
MNSICIVTDDSAQFLTPQFPGSSFTHILPNQIHLEGKSQKISSVRDLPKTAGEDFHPRLEGPSTESFRQLFQHVGQSFNVIICILNSSHLTSSVDNAREAAAGFHGAPVIQIIDSGSFSIGLGLIVQSAAKAIQQGANGVEVERIARDMIQRSYAVICAPGLSYLSSNHFLDHAQASVGEMLSIFPVYSLEDGNLVPVDKVRNHRHAIIYYQEFIEEFDDLENIAFLQSAPPNPQDTRLLREFVHENFGGAVFSEHSINLPCASLFGPRTTSLFLVESQQASI